MRQIGKMSDFFMIQFNEVAHKIVQQIKTKQFYEQLHAKTGKNREIQLNQQTI